MQTAPSLPRSQLAEALFLPRGPAHGHAVAVLALRLAHAPRPRREARRACGPRRRAGAARARSSLPRRRPRPRRAARQPPRPSAPRSAKTVSLRAACVDRAPRARAASTRSSLFQTSNSGVASATPRLGQDVGHVLRLFGGLGVADVADMQDQVRLQHLFQRGAEGGDKLGRQVGDEAHGVGEDDLARPTGSTTPRIVGSSVAKSMSLASTSAPVMRLKSVDLPALV